MYREEWTKPEKKVAARAFNLALEREYKALTEKIRRPVEA